MRVEARHHRKATRRDAKRLFELRRKSILELAPSGMAVAQSERWAVAVTIEGMEQKIREMEVWVAEVKGTIVGWVAMRGDCLEGLYTDPEFAGRGVATELLGLAEQWMRERGIETIRAEASWNSEAFYLRRGYEPAGPRPSDGARPIVKRLVSN